MAAHLSVDFVWLPRPRVVGTIEHDQFLLRIDDTDDELPPVQLTGEWRPPPLENPSPFQGGRMRTRQELELASLLVGDDRAVQQVRGYLVNYRAALLGVTQPRVWELGEWSVRLEPLDGLPDRQDYLKSTALYSFTHGIQIERTDGAPFRWSETERLRQVLLDASSFINGSSVGLALPAAFDVGGDLAWCRWECTTTDRGRNTFSWCDRHHFDDQADALMQGLNSLYADEFWCQVVGRAVRIYVDANEPRPIDTAIPTAQTGLEVLAWAVLERYGWVEPGARLDAAGRIRLLLKWADIPTVIPADMEALQRISKSYGNGRFDGPRVLTWVRGELIHLPKKPLDWPRMDTLAEVWRLATWYLELVLLRLASYDDKYANRLPRERWVGVVEPVPWSSGSSQQGS